MISSDYNGMLLQDPGWKHMITNQQYKIFSFKWTLLIVTGIWIIFWKWQKCWLEGVNSVMCRKGQRVCPCFQDGQKCSICYPSQDVSVGFLIRVLSSAAQMPNTWCTFLFLICVLVIRQLNSSIAITSLTSGQCRLAPLIQVIQDTSHLYHFTVKLLFKLHACKIYKKFIFFKTIFQALTHFIFLKVLCDNKKCCFGYFRSACWHFTRTSWTFPRAVPQVRHPVTDCKGMFLFCYSEEQRCFH